VQALLLYLISNYRKNEEGRVAAIGNPACPFAHFFPFFAKNGSGRTSILAIPFRNAP
jgi:hypothetical protein